MLMDEQMKNSENCLKNGKVFKLLKVFIRNDNGLITNGPERPVVCASSKMCNAHLRRCAAGYLMRIFGETLQITKDAPDAHGFAYKRGQTPPGCAG